MDKRVTTAILDIQQQNSSELVVVSGSMMPTLMIGDKVDIKDINDLSVLRPGDVVVYKNSFNQKIVHRLFLIKNYIAITKGDNKSDLDSPISIFDIIGTIEGKSSKKALWYYFFRNKLRKISILRKIWLKLKSF